MTIAGSTDKMEVNDYFASRYWLLESVRAPATDADGSLLWLLLSPLDGSDAVPPPELGLAKMTSLCPPAEVLCAAAAADDDDDGPGLTGMPSNCCLLVTVISSS